MNLVLFALAMIIFGLCAISGIVQAKMEKEEADKK